MVPERRWPWPGPGLRASGQSAAGETAYPDPSYIPVKQLLLLNNVEQILIFSVNILINKTT